MEAVIHQPQAKGAAQYRRPSSRTINRLVRERLERWEKINPRADTRLIIDIKQGERISLIKVRRETVGALKSKSPLKLNELEEKDLQDVGREMGCELGLSLGRNALSCVHGYAWVIFTLTTPVL